jgi:predicted dehydrogenase
MASFIGNDEVEVVSADFASTIQGRELEDDAMVNFRTLSGIVGRLWTSSVAIGRQHGFDIQVFGEKGGLRWISEQPNQLIYSKLGNRTEIIEKGEENLYDDAVRLSRVAIAHPEGFPLAVANIYVDIAAVINGNSRENLPTASDGLRSMAAVYAATKSAKNTGEWTDARPPMFR